MLLSLRWPAPGGPRCRLGAGHLNSLLMTHSQHSQQSIRGSVLPEVIGQLRQKSYGGVGLLDSGPVPSLPGGGLADLEREAGSGSGREGGWLRLLQAGRGRVSTATEEPTGLAPHAAEP